jgi:hypothetical protein
MAHKCFSARKNYALFCYRRFKTLKGSLCSAVRTDSEQSGGGTEGGNGWETRGNMFCGGFGRERVGNGEVKELRSVECIIECLGAPAKLRKVNINRLSVRPHATAGLLLDGFSWNLIFEYFRYICQENQVSLKSDKNSGNCT